MIKMNTYKLQITRIELEENKYWQKNIVIKQIKVMDENWKYIKFWKLDKLFKVVEPQLKNTILELKTNYNYEKENI